MSRTNERIAIAQPKTGDNELSRTGNGNSCDIAWTQKIDADGRAKNRRCSHVHLNDNVDSVVRGSVRGSVFSGGSESLLRLDNASRIANAKSACFPDGIYGICVCTDADIRLTAYIHTGILILIHRVVASERFAVRNKRQYLGAKAGQQPLWRVESSRWPTWIVHAAILMLNAASSDTRNSSAVNLSSPFPRLSFNWTRVHCVDPRIFDRVATRISIEERDHCAQAWSTVKRNQSGPPCTTPLIYKSIVPRRISRSESGLWRCRRCKIYLAARSGSSNALRCE